MLNSSFKGLITCLLISVLTLNSIAQETLRFIDGEVKTENQIHLSPKVDEWVDGKFFRIIQFYELPSQEYKSELIELGIELLDYIPNNAYYAAITNTSRLDFAKYGIKTIIPVFTSYKLSTELKYDAIDEWAIDGSKVLVNALFYRTISKSQITASINKLGAEIVKINDAQVVRIKIDRTKLEKLYELSCFYYFEQIEKPGQPENLVGATNHRSNTLATAYDGGTKYDGTGVNIMMQDDGFIGPHIDYIGRIEHRGVNTNSGDHGDHVAGIIMGAGNIDPTARGMAFGSFLYVYDSGNDNYDSVPNLYNNEEVLITSKSYGNGVNAGYTSLTRQLDQQVRTMPELIHVFSGGNSNGSGSTSAGSSWFNITGGHKAGKNVLAVANLTANDNISNSSSRGPASDGRIKPDISAVGSSVYSTIDANSYGTKSGTSMACPGVAGVLGQLYGAYRNLNAGANPPSGLIKGIILNTADDIGNVGPDFTYGWGRINGRRAIDVLTDNQYLSSAVSNGVTNTHSITVPSGVHELRAMVYWTDYEGTANSSIALVNDLNVTVTDPTFNVFNPWVLDPTPNSSTLNLPATRGIDNLNNMEQITIDVPAAGVYNVDVSGFSIPQGPQEYYLVYEFIYDEIVLTYPQGGEHLDPQENEKIRWDAVGNSGSFTVEFSSDNGASWTVLSSTVPGNRRYYDWNIPNTTVTGEGLIRVSRGPLFSQSITNFSVIGVPTQLSVESVCPDSMTVSWNPVTDATGYEVSLLGDFYMDSVGSTMGLSSTTLTIPAPTYEEKWFSVKALGANNCEGRRAIAISQSAGLVNCPLDFDATVVTLAPENGTFYSCHTPDFGIALNILNNGLSAIDSIPVSYSIDGAAPISDTIFTTLNPNEDTLFNFSPNMMLTAGVHSIKAWSSLNNDQNTFNDTLSSEIKYLNTILTLPVTQNFEMDATCSTDYDCDETVCPLVNDWINETNNLVDNIDWRVNSGATPSRVGTSPNETGPLTDFNPGNTLGNYIYTEASNGCEFQTAELVSPCIDLSLAENPELTFAYHMFDLQGGHMGTLNIDVYSNGVWNNAVITEFSGDKDDIWNIANVDLSAFTGEMINIRFRGETGGGWRSDIAIDDIVIKEASSASINELDQNFRIYPNPSEGIVNYEFLNSNFSENVTISITDVQGKIIDNFRVTTDKEINRGTLDLTHLPKGLYHLQLVTSESLTVKKIVLW